MAELAVPDRGVEADTLGCEVSIDDEGVLKVVVNNLPVAISVSDDQRPTSLCKKTYA